MFEEAFSEIDLSIEQDVLVPVQLSFTDYLHNEEPLVLTSDSVFIMACFLCVLVFLVVVVFLFKRNWVNKI